MTEAQKELYTKTVRRLERIGAKDPTAQIIALAEEIEQYRRQVIEGTLGEQVQRAVSDAWETNLDSLTAGAFGDPLDPETLLRYWEAQEAAGYPYASENVKYFKELMCIKKEDTSPAERPCFVCRHRAVPVNLRPCCDCDLTHDLWEEDTNQ